MANIPVNSQAQLLIAGQSLTGSFSGFLGTAAVDGTTTNQTIRFLALKDGIGTNLISGSELFIPAGIFVPLTITSASLHPTSGAVLFFR